MGDGLSLSLSASFRAEENASIEIIGNGKVAHRGSAYR